MIKMLINKIVSLVGYSFEKKYDEKTYLNNLLKIFIKKNDPIILDVGANKGQSVDRFQSIFEKPYIYCFEPVKSCFNLLKQKKIKIIQVEIILQDVYSKYLNIYDIEKYIIPNSYRLLATNKFGNLIDNYSFQMDILYTTKDLYKKISKN